MIPLLEKAFTEAAKLPDDQQAALARRILATVESDLRWQSLLDQPDEMLEQWAAEALKAHRDGNTQPIEGV